MHQPASSHHTAQARWRKQHPILVLQRSGRQNRIVFTPLVTAMTLGSLMLLLLAIIVSAGYMMLREDILGATISRHARAQHAYEDRITALRAQVDLVTSRQLLDQQAVEKRVSRLLAKQEELGLRQHHVSKAFDRAHKFKAVPRRTPKRKTSINGLRLGSLVGTSSPFQFASSDNGLRRGSQNRATNPEFFDSLEASLAEAEKAQLAELRSLKQSADSKVIKLASILSGQGIRVPDATAVGGPLIALKAGNKFMSSVSMYSF